MFGYTKLMQAMSGVAGAVTDAFFNLVTLLLNTTATNGAQNNTFLDSSTNNFTITRNGNTTQGTFTPFSQTGWSAFNVGTASFCQLNNADYSLSTGDFTIEFFMFVTSDKAATCFASAASNPDLTVAMGGGSAGARQPYLEYAGAGTSFTAFSNYLNNWVHVAFVRSSGTVTVYQNGVALSSASKAGAVGTTVNLKLLRNSGDANQDFPGYMSNFRICKAAVYTSNFTPTTTNFTTSSQGATSCQLLTFQDNRFVDNSSNAATVTPTLTQVQAFSPFLPTIEYDTAVVGGSGYFDGTGDYLSLGLGTDFNLSTSDFMMEFWYYCTSVGAYAPGIFCKRVGGLASGWVIQTSGFICDMGGTWYDSSGLPYWVGSIATPGFGASSSLTKLNQWTHVVLTRQGTNARWFVNGQMLGYESRTGAIQQLTGSLLSVGLGGTTSESPYTGYLSNGRISIGSVPTGYQTSSTTVNAQIFTPPTAPVTQTSQGATAGDVEYIGNFTNSGIFDSTAKNVLETVGNAQVSTTTAQFGTTSMYFDGVGDCLIFPATPNFLFSGDFTIEGWFNRDNGVDGSIFVMNTSGADYFALNVALVGYSVYLNATGPNFSPTVTLSNNTWYYVALVRSGSTVTLYHNGTSVGTATNSAVLGAATVVGYVGGINGGLKAYIDDLRITKYARYTANFSVPTAAFPLQ